MHQCFVACTSEAFSKKWLGILAEYVMRGGYGDSCEQDRENEWNQMVLGVQGPVAMAISALSTHLNFLPVSLLRNTLSVLLNTHFLGFPHKF